jgi:UDP-glucose 4-epimerase
MSKNVLVTGGCGFIGSNLVNKISESKDWNIDVVDNLINGKIGLINKEAKNHRLNLVVDDFTSPTILNRISSKKYDYIFHLAALPSVQFSVDNPLKSNDDNVSKTLILMETAKNNVKKFVFSSSSAIYGDVASLPIYEDNNKQPNSPYGLQKYIIEQYLEIYSKLYSFPYISLRYANVYGKNQLGGSPYSNVISAWLHNIKRGLPIRFDGDGLQTRDMVHVDDVVNANLLAAESNTENQAFNVGSGSRVSNLYILQLLKDIYGNINVVNAPKRNGDVKDTLLSIDHIKNSLNYYPSMQFENGLNRTINWANKSDIF